MLPYDEREWQKVKENAELRDKKANAKEDSGQVTVAQEYSKI